MKCSRDRYMNPVKLLSSDWIRPEDIHYYEELADRTGNSNISIKLLDRTSKTYVLEKVIRAYMSRSYEGNLLDILNIATKKTTEKVHTRPFYVKAITGLYNVGMLKDYGRVFEYPNYYVDNKRLDGFLKRFVNNYDCDKNFCDDEGLELNGSNGEGCRYCKQWAKQVIQYDADSVRQWGENTDAFKEKLIQGELFG
jgi:hypothetical protein